MIRRISALVALGVLCTIHYAAAQPTTQDAAAFDKAVVDTRSALYQGGFKFGTRLRAVLTDGKAEEAEAMKAALVDALIIMSKAREDWQAVKPPDSKSGRELHETFAKFLEAQQKSMQKDGLALVRIVLNKQLDQEEKGKKIGEVIQANQKLENEGNAQLEKARKALADEHQLKSKDEK